MVITSIQEKSCQFKKNEKLTQEARKEKVKKHQALLNEKLIYEKIKK